MTLLELEQACARARKAGCKDGEEICINIDLTVDSACGLWYRHDIVDGHIKLVLHNEPAMKHDV